MLYSRIKPVTKVYSDGWKTWIKAKPEQTKATFKNDNASIQDFEQHYFLPVQMQVGNPKLCCMQIQS